MISFKANFLDGRTSKIHPAVVYFDGKFLRALGPDSEVLAEALAEEVKIPPPLARSKRGLTFPGGEKLETEDLRAIEILESSLRKNRILKIVDFLERRWRAVALCFIGLILAVAAIIVFGIPLVSEKIAYALPQTALDKVSGQTLRLFDKALFKPSELDTLAKTKVSHIFRQVVTETAADGNYRILFKKSPAFGPNALALPSGQIIITDELVRLTSHDLQLKGILAHEIAHVEKRHSLRSVFQSAGVFFLVAALVGDVASMTSIAASLPALLTQTGYSRKFEKEADKVAALYLLKKYGTVKPYIYILQKMADEHKAPSMPSVFSTHPNIEERVKFLEKISIN